jgi:hypothetical protein
MLTIAAALSLASPSPPRALACPNCKEAVAAQEPAQAARLKNGYFYSILLMISMPVLLTGAGIILVARAIKRGAFPEL